MASDFDFDYDDGRFDSYDDPYDCHEYERTRVRSADDIPKKRKDNSGCLTAFYVVLIIVLIGVVWWALGKAILACECAVIKWFPESPPYSTTEDSHYHRESCPYITESNCAGEEFYSRKDAEKAGYEPCPHCLE